MEMFFFLISVRSLYPFKAFENAVNGLDIIIVDKWIDQHVCRGIVLCDDEGLCTFH